MVKSFNFPSFESWRENNFEFSDVIGAYHCRIARFSYGITETVFRCAVSVSENPLNIYSDCIFNNAFCWRSHKDEFGNPVFDEITLKTWYEGIIIGLNNFWVQYLKSTYLE